MRSACVAISTASRFVRLPPVSAVGTIGAWPQRHLTPLLHCRNHDPIRAGGESRRCPERNIRADAIDAFVFDHLRTAITAPAYCWPANKQSP
jgi:hypothetical protein